ncbi:hypothetical protein [Halorubellus sp. PRR65]|uniref:hypothetical protein n=1 Tax=Halorubellus sp. PRR65 TaxID=3098148 RepID=UPI002B25FFAB|nr:hypothetical protein [Halorubellus sp. PRR65]
MPDAADDERDVDFVLVEPDDADDGTEADAETGFVIVRDTDLVPVGDPTANYPAVIEDVETDFVLVETEDAEPTDFVLVDPDDADVRRDTGLVPVDPDDYALDTRPADPKRNGQR